VRKRASPKANSGCLAALAAVVQLECDIAEAKQRPNHFAWAAVEYATGIAQEGADLGGAFDAIKAPGSENAEAVAADDAARIVTGGKSESDVVDSVRAAHVTH
jgi:hypothetical protein